MRRAFSRAGATSSCSIASLLAFLLPLTYENVPATFGAVALVGIVLAVMTTGVIHLALNSVREHRRRLKFLIDATASFDTSLDPAEALRNLAHAAVPELAELCVIDLLDRDGRDRPRTVAAALDADVALGVESLRRREPLDLDGEPSGGARAGQRQNRCVIDDLNDESRAGAGRAERRAPALHAQRRLPLGGCLSDDRARAHARRDLLPARRQRGALRTRSARRARRPQRAARRWPSTTRACTPIARAWRRRCVAA